MKPTFVWGMYLRNRDVLKTQKRVGPLAISHLIIKKGGLYDNIFEDQSILIL